MFFAKVLRPSFIFLQTGTYLDVTYDYSGQKHATIPLDINWEAGSEYTIDIKLGTTLIQ